MLAVLGPGEIFGEMALLGTHTRTATARAIEPTEIINVSRAHLLSRLQKADPILKRLTLSLVKRLRRTTASIHTDSTPKNGEQEEESQSQEEIVELPTATEELPTATEELPAAAEPVQETKFSLQEVRQLQSKLGPIGLEIARALFKFPEASNAELVKIVSRTIGKAVRLSTIEEKRKLIEEHPQIFREIVKD